MGIAAILFFIALILAVIDIFVDTAGRGVGRATLLHVAVVLVCIGLLLGGVDLASANT